jgi:hypothetical protein
MIVEVSLRTGIGDLLRYQRRKFMPKSGRTIWVVFVLAGMMLASASQGQAQDRPKLGTVGVTASIQSSQLDLMVPIWVAPSVVIAPAGIFTHRTSTLTDYGVGMVTRFYMGTGQAAPFLGVRGAVLVLSPDEGDSVMDFLFGGLAGGEYFLSPHFGISVEAQLNVTIADEDSFRFAAPGETNINTATGVFASFYF